MNSHSTELPTKRPEESPTPSNFSREDCHLTPQEIKRLEQISKTIRDLRLGGSRFAVSAAEEPIDLTKMAELLSIYYEPQLTSHRPFLGPLIVFTKRFFLRFLNKWLMISLVKQKELNHMLFDVALTVQALELRIQSLENQLKGQA